MLLAAETRRNQERLRFLRSYASTWGPAAAPWTALSVSWTLARTRSEQADGLPAIVGQFRKYSERMADWKRRDGCRVIICIDEMDKIRDSDRAESFLNEIKAIFDVPGCLYLVAISEDAMTVFASRTPASFTRDGQVESAAGPVDQFAGGLGAVRVWPSSPPAKASGPGCAPASPAG